MERSDCFRLRADEDPLTHGDERYRNETNGAPAYGRCSFWYEISVGFLCRRHRTAERAVHAEGGG